MPKAGEEHRICHPVWVLNNNANVGYIQIGDVSESMVHGFCKTCDVFGTAWDKQYRS